MRFGFKSFLRQDLLKIKKEYFFFSFFLFFCLFFLILDNSVAFPSRHYCKRKKDRYRSPHNKAHSESPKPRRHRFKGREEQSPSLFNRRPVATAANNYVVPLRDLANGNEVRLRCKSIPIELKVQSFYISLDERSKRRRDSFQFFDIPDRPFCIFYDNYQKIPRMTVHTIWEGGKDEKKRRGNFRGMEETSLPSNNQLCYRYNSEIYTRGHLVPAGDYPNEFLANKTFIYPNAAPQVRSFNSGPWNALERQIRLYAKKTQHRLIIVTGVGFKDNIQQYIYPEDQSYKIAVPDFFYKVVIDIDENPIRFVAYRMKNKNYEGRDPQETAKNSVNKFKRIAKYSYIQLDLQRFFPDRGVQEGLDIFNLVSAFSR